MFAEAGITEDQRLIQHAVSQLEKSYDLPYFLGRARTETFPSEFWQTLAEQGYLGATVAEAHGGAGFSTPDLCEFLTAMGRHRLASLHLLSHLVCCDLVTGAGNAAVRDAWLTAMVAGQRWTYGLLETTTGESLFDVATTATAVDGGFRLDGRKRYVVGAKGAHTVVVAARTAAADAADPRAGLRLFAVPMDHPGVSVHGREINVRVTPDREPMAATGDAFYDVEFDAVTVDAQQCLDALDGGAAIELAAGRLMLMLGAVGVGWGDRILEQTVGYANARVIYQDPIGAYQAVQHPMVLAKTAVEMARLLVRRAATAWDEVADPDDRLTYAALAKHAALEGAYAACDIGIQAHGGSGFDRDTGIITLWPLILLARLVPLNSDAILERYGERALGLPVA